MGKEPNNWLYRYFHLEENHTNVKTEVIAGLTTFATMAYIVAVVPAMLAEGGLPRGSVLSVVVLMTVITTAAMAVYTNRPFALGPGMGSVAIFSLTLLKGGVPLPVASGIIVLSGLIFMAISFLGVRDFIVKIIPPSVKI
ncbi:MAG: NCS2 family permease, partial [Acetomicrobium sp.]|nr:NCS2 family permease [Acetomicrobium sp.]